MAKDYTPYCWLVCGPHVKIKVNDIFCVHYVRAAWYSLAGCVFDTHDLKTLARHWEAAFLFSVFL
jgi:hypothetical protein